MVYVPMYLLEYVFIDPNNFWTIIVFVCSFCSTCCTHFYMSWLCFFRWQSKNMQLNLCICFWHLSLERRGNSPARRMMTIPLANKDQNKLFYKTDVSFHVFEIRLINYDIVIIIIIINEYCSPLSPR